MIADLTIVGSVLTFLLAAGSPGPATLAVSAVAMAQGLRSGVAMALGLSVGLAFWGALVGFGFGAFVAQSVTLLWLLKTIGGLYLLYLAFVTARSAFGDALPNIVVDAAGLRGFRRGLVLNLANPKAVLAWVAALALGGQQTFAAPVAVVLSCSSVGVAIYLSYALLFSRGPVRGFYRRRRRQLELGFAALFGAAGLRLLVWKGDPV